MHIQLIGVVDNVMASSVRSCSSNSHQSDFILFISVYHYYMTIKQSFGKLDGCFSKKLDLGHELYDLRIRI
jgi:hypothetical protein